MTNLWRFAMAGMLALAGTLPGLTEASVVIGGTRVVYPAQDKEVTIKLNNEGAKPALVQVWMDHGDETSTPDTTKVPFTIAPPIFRMEAGKAQAVRVMYTKEPLPTDKESLFWVNVLEVPPKADNEDGRNLLQFAFRTRIKLFFRPSGLPGDVADAPDRLVWKLVDHEGKVALQVSNPTPYYVNFAHVGLKTGGQSYTEEGGGMVAPSAMAIFPITQFKGRPGNDAKAQFDVISDFGAIGAHEKPLTH